MSERERDRDTMDRKPYRQSSVPPKGNGTENKKDVGGSSNQKFPRQNRRKDQGNRNINNDQQAPVRRPQPQKSRSMDKRPRSRGFNNGNNREVTNVEEAGAEYGSVQAWGSKKSNLSHLLNFHFEPRGDTGGRGRDQTSGKWTGNGRGHRNQVHRYNKEHFLQANCQFIVRDGEAEYSVHAVNPDVLVDWDLIEQVRIYSHGVPSCPICLYPPTAAKITKCGHVYCWACILHYLSLGDKVWRRCPICYDAIQERDLKSVIALETRTYRPGEEITLNLMKRKKGTTFTMPVGQWTDREGQLYSLDDNVDIRYAKLLVASTERIQQIIDSERRDLQTQLENEGLESLEGSFVEAAMKLLQTRQQALNLTANVKEDVEEMLQRLSVSDKEETDDCKKFQDEKKMKSKVVYSSAFSDEEAEPAEATLPSSPVPCDEAEAPQSVSPSNCQDESDATSCTGEGAHDSSNDAAALARAVELDSTASVTDDPVVAMEDTTVRMLTDGGVQHVSVSSAAEELTLPQETFNGEMNRASSDHFYFFQASDGQCIYLHSLNARCLVKEYGSLEKCPQTITANIVELDGVSMNEQLRHRLRYLGHLPVTCEFQVAELALKPPVVSRDTLRFFSGDIEKKRKHRQRKAREEKRFSRRVQEQENKDMGIDPNTVIVRSEAAQSVFVGFEAPSTHATGSVATIQSSIESTPVGSPTVASGTELLATSPKGGGSSDEGGQTMSFAQMLKAGKAKPKAQEAWPKSTSNTCPGADQPKARTKGSDSEASDNEDRVPVPLFRASFGDAIQQALDKYKTPEGEVKVDGPQAGPVKKKKKQKTLLFTTTMSRSK